MWRRGYLRIIDLCGDAITGTTSRRWRGAPEFDFHTGWKEGGVYRESQKDGPMRAALEQLWASQRDQANKGFEALVTADKDAGGDGKWWLRHEKRWGPSRFFGVRMEDGRWMVRLTVDGKLVYFGKCDNEEDAARLADALRVVVRGEAPKNYPQPFVEFLEAGGGDVPAALVAAALRRDGRVDVKPWVSVEAIDAAKAAASSVEDEIAAAVAKPENQTQASTPLRDVPKAKWTVDQAGRMARNGVKTVGDLAKVNVDDEELALALTLCGRHADARKTLWRWKRAAALLLRVPIGDKPPPKNGTGRAVSKRERTTKEQDALDVAARWAASRGGTEDEKLATEYAEALAAIARGVSEPQKKKKRRR